MATTRVVKLVGSKGRTVNWMVIHDFRSKFGRSMIGVSLRHLVRLKDKDLVLGHFKTKKEATTYLRTKAKRAIPKKIKERMQREKNMRRIRRLRRKR